MRRFITRAWCIALAVFACGCAAEGRQSLFAKATPTPTATPAVTPTIEPTPTTMPTPTPTPEPQNRSQTSGKVIPVGTPSKPVIVSIENSGGAKPQTGLMQADIIYEFMVESMITRLQVLYNDSYAAYAGPLRSVRYYFVDLAQEWDCMYLHQGGVTLSGEYKRIPSKVISVYPRAGQRQFNGFTSAYSSKKSACNDYETRNGYRFRSADRNAPHNLYVLVDRTVNKYYGDHEAAIRERFRFMEGVSYEYGEAFTRVSLPYLNEFNPTWIEFAYDAASNRLMRYENSEPFMTISPSADGTTSIEEQMNVQNLIVQYVEYGKIKGDTAGRRSCQLIGTGKCDYFINGQHVTGTWSRPTLEDYTTYCLDDGSVVILEPGNTWIAVHPNTSAAQIK